MRTAVVIPARLGSTRFPGKVLADLMGKSLIQHVHEGASRSTLASEVIIATDSTEVFQTVESFGGKAVMTSEAHASGTDRIAEVALEMDCDIIVNVQGDEPLIHPEVIDQTIMLLEDERADMSTMASRITHGGEILDSNTVKVVFDHEGFALYFSRAPIPFHRDQWADGTEPDAEHHEIYKHIGIYGYRREALIKLASLPQSRLEQAEKLEQLRALENGMRIKVALTTYETMGVDTPNDLERVRKCLSSSS